MKKRRTKLTKRAENRLVQTKILSFYNKAVSTTNKEYPDRSYDSHVLAYELIKSNSERWTKINTNFTSYPNGCIVDLPWLPFWRSVSDLYEDDYDHEVRDDRWLDDAEVARRRSVTLEDLRKMGRHRDEIENYHSLLCVLREVLDENIIAIGKGCGYPVYDFEAMRKLGRRESPPIDHMTIKFVLPDEHEAFLFKLRWS